MRLNRIEAKEREGVETLLEAIDRKLERLLQIAESQSRPNPPSPLNDFLQTLNGRLALGLKECAKALGVSQATLRRLIGQGKLRAVRVGGRVLLQADELKRLIAGKG
jgi:excisionase family DNA binding protein